MIIKFLTLLKFWKVLLSPKMLITRVGKMTWHNWLAIAIFAGNMVMWYYIWEYLGVDSPEGPAKWVQLAFPFIIFVAPIVTLFTFRWLAARIIGLVYWALGKQPKEDSIHGDKRSRKPCCRESGKGSTPLSSSENKN